MTPPVFRRALAAVLLLSLTLPPLATRADDERPARKLPPDLALVPDDTQWFVTIRAADLLENPTVKKLLPLLPGPDGKTGEMLASIEREIGIAPASVERVTAVFRRPRGLGVGIIRTLKPYDRAAILKPYKKTEDATVHGKKVVIAHGKFGPDMIFHFADDRTIVMGDGPTLVPFLAAVNDTGKTHPLGDALLAAAGKHKVVVAARPWLLYRVNDAQVRAERLKEKEGLKGGATDKPPLRLEGYIDQPLKLRSLEEIIESADTTEASASLMLLPAIRCRRVALALDLSNVIRVAGKAEFKNDEEAKDCEAMGHYGQFVLRELFPIWFLKGWGASPKAPSAADLLTQYKAAVRGIDLSRDGKTIIVAARTRIDVAPWLKFIEDKKAEQHPTIARFKLQRLASAFEIAYIKDEKYPSAAICDKKGKPLLSWRVALLPHIGEEKLYKEFKLDEPWDSAHNRKLLGRMPSVYEMPGRPADAPSGTYFQVFTGPKTPFPTPDAPGNVGANTLLIVEASKAVPWTKPEDIALDPKKAPSLGGRFPNYVLALWGNRAVTRVRRDPDEKTLRSAIDPTVDSDKNARRLEP